MKKTSMMVLSTSLLLLPMSICSRKGTLSTDQNISVYESQKNRNDDWSVILHKEESSIDESFGYVIVDTYCYHFAYDNHHLFRMEQRIEFTSGSVAIEDEFNKNCSGLSAVVTNSFKPYTVQNHYGSFTTPTPILLNYWPKNTPQYKTIQSGVSGGVSWGSTSTIGVHAGTDSFGTKANSSFTSSFNLNFNYSETYTDSYPTTDFKELPSTQGYGMKITNFSGEGITEKTVCISSGMLFESNLDSTQGFDILGILDVDVEFKVMGLRQIGTISYKKSFNLENA